MTERNNGAARPPAAKRPGSRTSGTNTLITAASLALTLSGWAVIAAREAEPAPPVAVAIATPTPLPTLPAVPTLVPRQSFASAPPRRNEAAAQPVPTTAPAAPAQAAAPPARPPKPVTVTRSSR